MIHGEFAPMSSLTPSPASNLNSPLLESTVFATDEGHLQQLDPLRADWLTAASRVYWSNVALILSEHLWVWSC